MSTSFFLLIRKLKDQNVYSRELARQYAMFRSVTDQVDNIRFKNFVRMTNYRLVFQERASVTKLPASQYKPIVPPEGTPPGGPSTDSKFSYVDTVIDAKGSDGTNLPRYVNDGLLATRWSYNGIPSWLRVDLGEDKNIAFVRVAWWKGNERKYSYTIAGGDTPQATQVIKAGTSTGQTTGFETYDFTDRQLRYIVLWVNSNVTNAGITESWSSVAEFEIWGRDIIPPESPPPPPPPAQPTKFVYPSTNITASSNDGNTPDKVNDNNFTTGWRAVVGYPQWIKVDLGAERAIHFVDMRWTFSASQPDTVSFNVETSSNNSTWSTKFTGTHIVPAGFSTTQSASMTPHLARYIRINITGRSVVTQAGMSELGVWGLFDLGTPIPSPPPAPPGPPPPPSSPIPQGTLSLHLNFNDTLNDSSGANNHALLNVGTLRFAPGQTSALGNAVDLNPLNTSSTETFEKLWVPFSNTTQILHNTSPGFSVFCRIYPYTLALTAAGYSRVIWIKQDDMNNGAHAILGPDGTVYFHVKHMNTRYKIRSTPSAVVINSWSALWFTFNKTTNQAFLYVNNQRHNLVSTYNEYWNNIHGHFIIGNFYTGSAQTPFRGRIDDFRLYRNGVISDTSVQNLEENKFTIETVPMGNDYGPAIAGFVKLDEPLNNDVFVHDDVADDMLILPPTPPSPPPGTDD